MLLQPTLLSSPTSFSTEDCNPRALAAPTNATGLVTEADALSAAVASVSPNILGSLSAASPLLGCAIPDLGDKMLDEGGETEDWYAGEEREWNHDSSQVDWDGDDGVAVIWD